MAFSLALKDGKAKALGIKLLLFGPEFVGKTCLVATLTGDPYEEKLATEGSDMHICNTTNWEKISSDEVMHRLQNKYLSDLKATAECQAQNAKDIIGGETTTSGAAASLKPKPKSNVFLKVFRLFTPRSKVQAAPHRSKHIQSVPSVDVDEIIGAKAAGIFDDDNSIDVTILDFAGQLLYHSTHSVFIRKDNVIMVVFNASRPLSSNVKVRSSTLRSDPMTNSQNVHFWMKTVQSICHIRGDKNDISTFLPAIVLVATHVDLLGDSADEVKEEIIQQLADELEGKPYAEHLAGHREGLVEALRKYCIFVSNKHRDSEMIAQLHDAVLQVSLPILSKEYPIIYLKIEKSLLSISKGVITLEEFHGVAESCGFHASIGSQEFAVVLQYFHHRGTILHFASVKNLSKLVILSPQWLTKLISYLLIAHPYQRIGGKHDKSFSLLTRKGILLGSFLAYMLGLFNQSEFGTGFQVDLQQAVDIMSKFSFIAHISSNTYFLEDKDVSANKDDLYIVPSLLLEDPGNTKIVPNEFDDNVRVVYYNFPDEFVPEMIFNQMVAACLSRNTNEREDLVWLRKGKVKMVLGSGQYYIVSHNEEKCSIQLSIVFIPNTDHSAKQRKDLLKYFKTNLDELMTNFMPAAKKPVAHIPCYHCGELHAELLLLLKGQQQHCPIKDQPIPKRFYTDLITDQGHPTGGRASSLATGYTKSRLCETEVLKWLKEVPRWQEVGIYLLPKESAGKDIETIGINNQFQVRLCHIALATLFVHCKTVEVTWKRVYEAFKQADYINIAADIKKTYKL